MRSVVPDRTGRDCKPTGGEEASGIPSMRRTGAPSDNLRRPDLRRAKGVASLHSHQGALDPVSRELSVLAAAAARVLFQRLTDRRQQPRQLHPVRLRQLRERRRVLLEQRTQVLVSPISDLRGEADHRSAAVDRVRLARRTRPSPDRRPGPSRSAARLQPLPRCRSSAASRRSAAGSSAARGGAGPDLPQRIHPPLKDPRGFVEELRQVDEGIRSC